MLIGIPVYPKVDLLDVTVAAQPGELGIGQLLEQEERPQLVCAAAGRLRLTGHSFSR